MVTRVIDKNRRCGAGWRAQHSRTRRRGGDFLLAHVIAELAERLVAIERRFAVAVAHGGQTDALAQPLVDSGKVGSRLSPRANAPLAGGRAFRGCGRRRGSAAARTRFDRPLRFDALALQWTNDLPGALIQIRRALKPDGLFLAALTGGNTLAELREAFFEAESEIRGGASPRVMPAADVRDLGALLQRAGFALPVADRDVLTVRYATAFDLFRDLRAMGATTALVERARRPAHRKLFVRAAEIYAERFSDPDGRIRATFEIVFLSGRAPAPR